MRALPRVPLVIPTLPHPCHISQPRATGTCISSSASPSTRCFRAPTYRVHRLGSGTARRYLQFPSQRTTAPTLSLSIPLRTRSPIWNGGHSQSRQPVVAFPTALAHLLFVFNLSLRPSSPPYSFPCLICRAIPRHDHWLIAICCATGSGPIAATTLPSSPTVSNSPLEPRILPAPPPSL